MGLRNYTEATAYAELLRNGLEGTLRNLMLTPSLTASILTDIEEYAEAVVRVHSLAAAEVLKQMKQSV